MSGGRLRVLTLVGTRPELIKLSRVIAALDQHTDHVLVHSGQNYDFELNEIFFKDLGIRKPDHFLEVAGASAAETIGAVIAKTDALLDKVKPDAFLIYGDTNTCLGVIAAKRRKVPVFHMEAGNRCFDQRVPEEINRKIVDHLSDINMPLTEHARGYLVREGIRAETIIKTGSSLPEVLSHNRKKIEESDVLKRLGLEEGKFFVASFHREENVDEREKLASIVSALEALAFEHKIPVVISTHPRTKKRLDEWKLGGGKADLRFLAPLGFSDYVYLQMNAKCVLSDSGTITEESSILDFPAVMLRQAHERPEGMDEGTLIMSGLESKSIREAVVVVTSQQKHGSRKFRAISDYAPENVSEKVVRIIYSYTAYVRRTVWGL